MYIIEELPSIKPVLSVWCIAKNKDGKELLNEIIAESYNVSVYTHTFRTFCRNSTHGKAMLNDCRLVLREHDLYRTVRVY